MAVRITIEAASKAEAELIAEQLPVKAEAHSWRGFGVIRLGAKSKQEMRAVLEAVERGFREHSFKWARVRYGDEERVFKANGKRSDFPGPHARVISAPVARKDSRA